MGLDYTRNPLPKSHRYRGIGFGRVGSRGQPSSQAQVVRACSFFLVFVSQRQVLILPDPAQLGGSCYRHASHVRSSVSTLLILSSLPLVLLGLGSPNSHPLFALPRFHFFPAQAAYLSHEQVSCGCGLVFIFCTPRETQYYYRPRLGVPSSSTLSRKRWRTQPESPPKRPLGARLRATPPS